MSRFNAPFIFKMSFYSASAKNQAKNAAHINYIGTRPGADLGEIEIPEEEMEDSNVFEPDTAAGHIKYAHERPGSHGLFTAREEKPHLKGIQQELQEHQGVVWRVILSLKEEDAKRLDFDSRQKWEDTLRAAVPDAAQKMGIGESNLRWVAAFHQEKGHPHVHLVMWEKQPKRSKGLLSKGERIDVKKAFMKEVYAEERTRLLQEKTAMRDLIRDRAKGDTEKAISLLEDVKKHTKDVELEHIASGGGRAGIAPKAYPEDIKKMVVQLHELSKIMPGKGRAALQYMPEDIKQQARAIADHLIHQPAFKDSLDRYMKSVEDMTRLHTVHPDAVKKAKEKAYDDLRDRVANVVVRGSAKINREENRQENAGGASKASSLETSIGVAKGLWKNVWKAVEHVRMQSEAQGELRRRELQRQQKKQLQNNREHEQGD